MGGWVIQMFHLFCPRSWVAQNTPACPNKPGVLCLVSVFLNTLWQVLYLPLSTLSSGQLSPLIGGIFHKSRNYNKKIKCIVSSSNQHVLNNKGTCKSFSNNLMPNIAQYKLLTETSLKYFKFISTVY